jgi:hypothetical protein
MLNAVSPFWWLQRHGNIHIKTFGPGPIVEVMVEETSKLGKALCSKGEMPRAFYLNLITGNFQSVYDERWAFRNIAELDRYLFGRDNLVKATEWLNKIPVVEVGDDPL